MMQKINMREIVYSGKLRAGNISSGVAQSAFDCTASEKSGAD